MDQLLLLLQKRGLLNEEQIAHILERGKADSLSAAEVIRSERIIPDEEFAKMYAEFLDVPYIDLTTILYYSSTGLFSSSWLSFLVNPGSFSQSRLNTSWLPSEK